MIILTLNVLTSGSPDLVKIRGKTSEQYKRELKDKKYDSRWTLTHGFLAGMGGIRVYDGDDGPKKFRPGSKFFEDIKMRPIIQQIGLISSKDVQDKSKGDAMSKFFVLIQTTWFIVQCLARWAIHLPVTELEVVTLAYAVQNIFIYTLWWNKPQSLTVPYRLYLDKSEQISENLDVKDDNKQEELPLIPRSPSPNIADEAPNTNSLPKSETSRGRSRRGRKRSLLTHEVSVCYFMYISNASSQPKSGCSQPTRESRASSWGYVVGMDIGYSLFWLGPFSEPSI
jgi:hypothetical protein